MPIEKESKSSAKPTMSILPFKSWKFFDNFHASRVSPAECDVAKLIQSDSLAIAVHAPYSLHYIRKTKEPGAQGVQMHTQYL